MLLCTSLTPGITAYDSLPRVARFLYVFSLSNVPVILYRQTNSAFLQTYVGNGAASFTGDGGPVGVATINGARGSDAGEAALQLFSSP